MAEHRMIIIIIINDDDDRLGRPSTGTTPENVAKIRDLSLRIFFEGSILVLRIFLEEIQGSKK
jgi:hypothetical protein